MKFDLNRAKGRYGVAYLRALAAQARIGLSETPADEDFLAVDLTLQMPALDIRVQVKCTTREFSRRARELRYPVEDSWREKWRKNVYPVYFVVVRLMVEDAAAWIEHEEQATVHNARAFWTAIEPEHIPDQIRVSESQPLEASTFETWEQAVLGYGREREG